MSEHVWPGFNGTRYAYNWETRESRTMPVRPRMADFAYWGDWQSAYYIYLTQMKRWEAFVAAIPPLPEDRPRKLQHATEKGVPVPHTGNGRGGRWNPGRGKRGVISNSHVLSHHYADEGDKGQTHRRKVKAIERRMWRNDWQEELCQTDGYSAGEWFEPDPWEDIDYGYDEPYDLCNNGYCMGCYECDPEPEYCEYCFGPCEL